MSARLTRRSGGAVIAPNPQLARRPAKEKTVATPQPVAKTSQVAAANVSSPPQLEVATRKKHPLQPSNAASAARRGLQAPVQAQAQKAPARPPAVMDDSDSGNEVPTMPAEADLADAQPQVVKAPVKKPSQSTSGRRPIIVDDDEDANEEPQENNSSDDNRAEDDIYGGLDDGHTLREEAVHWASRNPRRRESSIESSVFNELLPTSGTDGGLGDINDGDDDDEAEDLPMPPKKKSRADVRREELPTWKDSVKSTQNTTSNSFPDEDDVEDEMPARQKRKKLTLGPISAHSTFPNAPYRRPGSDDRHIGIRDQPDTLATILSFTVRQVTRHAIGTAAYIKVNEIHSILCKIFIRTARDLGQEEYANRMKVDVMFQKDTVGMLKNRLQGFRGDVKARVTPGFVKGWYQLSGSNAAAKAAELIKGEKYLFPPSTDQGSEYVNKKKPFMHPAISAVIQDAFFKSEKGPSLVMKHSDLFASSSAQRPEELEITAPMAALAATCIHAALSQLSMDTTKGRSRHAFNTDIYEGIYDTHIEYLNNIREAATKYHRLMSDLYKQAAAGTAMDRASLGGAGIDFEGMSD